jgi:hypothetical protein
MKWCCLGFQSCYEEAGKKGFTVLVGRNYMGRPQFVLQYRIVDKGAEESVTSQVPISFVSDIHIQYCPWCGRKLDKWYGKYIDELHRKGFKVIIPGLDVD